MTEAPGHRLAALTGLALTTAVAVWWLGSTRLALDQGSDASRASAAALNALWLIRGLVLPILCVRLGASRGWRAGAASALALIAPSWPLVVLAWSASAASFTHAAMVEALLPAAGFACSLIGWGLHRMLRNAALSDVTATGVGITLAAVLWVTVVR